MPGLAKSRPGPSTIAFQWVQDMTRAGWSLRGPEDAALLMSNHD